MKSPISKDEFLKQLKTILEYDYRTAPKDATVTQIYRAVSTIVVNFMKEKRHNFMHECNSKGRKQVYYLSMEFLMGRSLKTSLYNLGLQDEVTAALEEIGVKID